MGAVLLLVFLPLLVAAIAFVSVGGSLAGILFVGLAAFVLGSLLYQARDWDREPKDFPPRIS